MQCETRLDSEWGSDNWNLLSRIKVNFPPVFDSILASKEYRIHLEKIRKIIFNNSGEKGNWRV